MKKECPVPMLQDDFEITALVDIYKELNPHCVLEIGSAHGGTLWCWITNSEKGTEITSVDLISAHKIYGGRQGLIESRALWHGWADEAEVKLNVIDGDSNFDDTAELVREFAPFDFIFIDGGHEYMSIATDVLFYWPMLRKGGVMALHDISYDLDHPHCIEVGRWWRDMNRAGFFGVDVTEIFETLEDNGIGVIRK